MAIYMKYGSINGDVTTQGFSQWIELESLDFGVGRCIASAARGSQNREASEPNISEIVVTKKMDLASTGLIEDAWGGELNNTVTIKLTTTTKNGVLTFLEYDLENCGLSSYAVDSKGEMPQENLSLNFTKITQRFSGVTPDTQAHPASASYDLTLMQAS
jgi:type VI secretion system secreted protein Hcp